MKRFQSVFIALALFACTEPTVPPSTVSSLHPSRVLVATENAAVLPSAYTSVMGEMNNSFPHTRNNLRYQQVFLGSDVIDPTIVRVCLRKDELFGGVAQTQTLTIKMGPTSLDYTNLTSSFDANYSAPPTEVFSGDVNVPAAVGPGTPADFDFCIPFTQEYVHSPGSNVIIEVVNTSATFVAQPRDACSESAPICTTARAFAFSPTAERAALVSRGGLVMKFQSPPPPPAPVDPANKDECKKGGWADFGFKNQGQCIKFVETGVDSRF